MNIYIFGDIDEAKTNTVLDKILSCKDDKIYVYINSNGGCDNNHFAIYECLRLSKKKIITFALDSVKSAAMVVYLAGDDRYAHNHSQFMIHETYYVEVDGAMKIEHYEKSKKDLIRETEKYCKLVCKRSKLTIAALKKYMKEADDGDWEFDAKLAKKLGIVTKMGLPIPPFSKSLEDKENQKEYFEE